MKPSTKHFIVFIILLLIDNLSSFKIHQKFQSKSRYNTKILCDSSNQAKSFFFSQKPFNACGLSEKFMNGVLSSLNVVRPSKIQALSYTEVYSGSNCIIADQTGSGKTLAYLLPVLQRLIELQRNKTISQAEERSPYIIIITPTTELALQVSKVVKSLANILKFRTACITSSSDMDAEQRKLRLGADILVSTPGRLLALMQRDEIYMRNVQCVVLDEADVLFMDERYLNFTCIVALIALFHIKLLLAFRCSQ